MGFLFWNCNSDGAKNPVLACTFYLISASELRRDLLAGENRNSQVETVRKTGLIYRFSKGGETLRQN